MSALTSEQIKALRHVVGGIRYALDEAGNPFYDGVMVESVSVVERLIADAEVDNVKRETSRAPIVSGSLR